jgi:hypothetical protein
MARLPYDTVCDLVYGSSGLDPGVVYATGPCRFVWEQVQLPLLFPLSGRIGYITLDFSVPTQAAVSVVGSVYHTDYSYADLIAIPSGSVPNYQVLFVETVSYRSNPTYYRAHVQIVVPVVLPRLLQEDGSLLLQEDLSSLLLS